jgi:hypothetical protein
MKPIKLLDYSDHTVSRTLTTIDECTRYTISNKGYTLCLKTAFREKIPNSNLGIVFQIEHPKGLISNFINDFKTIKTKPQ